MRSNEPAIMWQDALMGGNGLQGLLVYGEPLSETHLFNHTRLVYPDGGPKPVPDIGDMLGEVRRKMLEGKYKEGAKSHWEAANHRGLMEIDWTQTYHPGYCLHLEMEEDGAITGYGRSIDFETGEIKVEWTDRRGVWQRRSFVSRADNVIVTEIRRTVGGEPLTLTVKADMETDKLPSEMAYDIVAADGRLSVSGKYPSSLSDGGFEGVTRVVVAGGSVEEIRNGFSIREADGVLILTRLDTYRTVSEKSRMDSLVADLNRLPDEYEALFQRHAAIHAELFNRVTLKLNKGDKGTQDRSVEEMLAEANRRQGPVDLALLEAAFDAGKYVYLCSSGYYPPRLTGIWTGEWFPAWCGDFTLDANVNLAVTFGNIGNLPECMEGYFSMIEGQLEHWKTNARNLMGVRGILSPVRTDGEDGFHTHFNEDSPIQFWTAGADWLLLPFCEYVQVSGDMAFLDNRLYPWLKELALFYEDFLTVADENGHKMFVPSWSPENTPRNSDNQASINATMDIAAAKHALTAVIEACLALGREGDDPIDLWRNLLAQLPPYLVNGDGALKEWATDLHEDNYDHRHISHLYPVYATQEIDPYSDPALAAAAAKAMELRGMEDESAHGYAMRALAWVKLKNAEKTYGQVEALLSGNFFYRSLMTCHYPIDKVNIYNADAICSLPAIVVEMLVASKPGFLELLPALPEAWKTGEVKGVKGRNRITVEELSWDLEDRRLSATLVSNVDQTVEFRVRGGEACKLQLIAGERTKLDNKL